MGLINKVFAKEKFEQECIREAKKICNIDPQTINLIDYEKTLIDISYGSRFL